MALLIPADKVMGFGVDFVGVGDHKFDGLEKHRLIVFVRHFCSQ